MDFLPIFLALRRHKTAALLIALEIALSCAIVSNVLFVVSDRLDRVSTPSGLVESEVVQVVVSRFGDDRQTVPRIRADLAALRAVPGVESAAAVNMLPYTQTSQYNYVSLEPNPPQRGVFVSLYNASEDFLETLGLRLVAGRDFMPDEYTDMESLIALGDEAGVPSAIVTAALAERLFPDGNAVGRGVYFSDKPTMVVGVVERLIGTTQFAGRAINEDSLLLPLIPSGVSFSRYAIRTDPARRAEVLDAAVDALLAIDPNRFVGENGARTVEELREAFYEPDVAMAWLLVAVCFALLAVTAAGIVGLASFWVQQRTRQIGVRRALGATRTDILAYFQSENFLIATVGIALGMALAFGVNGLLMERYELARLPWRFLPVGALTVWVLGQLAVLGPALRAAAVPPAVATRSV